MLKKFVQIQFFFFLNFIQKRLKVVMEYEAETKIIYDKTNKKI
jgi:hypothetical protein